MKTMMMAAMIVAAGLLAAPAKAQDVHVRYHEFGWGGGWDRAYASGRIPTPPYFAIHPPVYYSYPVPRTYGYSPFAYPSYVMTPEIAAPAKPAMFENPHVKQEPAKDAAIKSTSDRKDVQTAPMPQVIENPFVDSTPVRSASLAR
jgi:hypothetical protein